MVRSHPTAHFYAAWQWKLVALAAMLFSTACAHVESDNSGVVIQGDVIDATELWSSGNVALAFDGDGTVSVLAGGVEARKMSIPMEADLQIRGAALGENGLVAVGDYTGRDGSLVSGMLLDRPESNLRHVTRSDSPYGIFVESIAPVTGDQYLLYWRRAPGVDPPLRQAVVTGISERGLFNFEVIVEDDLMICPTDEIEARGKFVEVQVVGDRFLVSDSLNGVVVVTDHEGGNRMEFRPSALGDRGVLTGAVLDGDDLWVFSWPSLEHTEPTNLTLFSIELNCEIHNETTRFVSAKGVGGRTYFRSQDAIHHGRLVAPLDRVCEDSN